MTAGNNASYSADITDRMRSGSAASPGIRMQFKSPMNRMPSDNPPQRNTSTQAHLPPISSTDAVASRRNSSKPVVPSEATNTGHADSSAPSSSWISSLRRMSSAK